MKATSKAVVASNGAMVEVATVHFEGKPFTAMGAMVDESRGVIVGYPGLQCPGRSQYTLRTWNGERIAELTVTGSSRGFYGSRLTCWALTLNGRRYTGRNSGLGMVLRLRARGTK